MVFHFNNITADLLEAAELLKRDLGIETGNGPDAVQVSVHNTDSGLRIETDGKQALIEYGKKSEFCRALGILCGMCKAGGTHSAEEKRVFEKLTFMQDNSRNAVSNIESVKKMLRCLAVMGYDSMQLYTEDTYELKKFPFFGYMRGRYSQQELRELDEYAGTLGIELVPCIQTLAHLDAVFKWPQFHEIRDTGNILLCNEEKTYEFIEEMVKTCAECFSTRRINIGMDEAEMLGRGKYLDKFSYEDRMTIMARHLERVLKICQKYGFQVMMWSDMFFTMLSGGNYYDTSVRVTDEFKSKIPEGVSLVYWDYYSRDSATIDKMMALHKEMSDRIIFAGGAWKWSGFAPLLQHSMLSSRLALKSCAEHGINEVLVTAWGDNGAECSAFSILPVLQLYAEYCYRRTLDEEEVAQRLSECTGIQYHDFMLLDLPNLTPDNPAPGRLAAGPAKYLFYQDILIGLFDSHVERASYPGHYRKCAELLKEAAGRAGSYAYIFDNLASLCEVLEIKCTLGIELKEAYDNKDEEGLRETVRKCGMLLECVERFHGTMRAQWYQENKAFGFEVIDIRIGGLKERIRTAQWSVERYLEKKCSRLEELECERLLQGKQGPLPYKHWADIVTAGII